ncbi:MAG: hypothetical protein R3274_00325 [Desulfobacterales bacterium]|nr:hypothetical protein [Desulfobacterales bacterium]
MRTDMTARLKIISGVVFATVLLALLPALSLAETIILKNGQSIEVDNIDEREKDIVFYMNGLKMRVSKEGVVRVVKPHGRNAAAPTRAKRNAGANTSPAERPVQTKKAIKINPSRSKKPNNNPARPDNALKQDVPPTKKIEVDPQPSAKPAERQTAKFRSEIRWCGLRNLRWGISRHALGLMQEIESETDQTDIKEYVRKNEDLKLGKAQLDTIVYAFWSHRLYAVTIWVSGHENYLALRNEIFDRFGVGLKNEENLERYLWSDTNSDRMLKYVEADQTGLFWMRSKDLNRKYQLSQIKTPSTYLKAMEAGSLRAN